MSTKETTTMREDEILLNRCRAAKTLQEQQRCFDDLVVFLESIARGNRDIDSEINAATKSMDVDVLAARENISRSLLTTWPYGQVSACIDRVLDACGPIISISTCSSLLKEIAAANPQNRFETQDALPLIKTTQWTPSTTSLPLRSIVHACWATLQRILLTSTPPPPLLSSNSHSSSSSKANPNSNNELNRLEMQRFVSTIVLHLPQILANACFAVNLKVPLHGTPTYFFPRLVYFAWMQIQSQIGRKPMIQTTNWNFNSHHHDDGDESLLFSVLYAKILMAQLIQTRRSDTVAQGLMQRFGESSNRNSLLGSATVGSGDNKGNEKDSESASLSSFLMSLKLKARDMASLILALLQYANQNWSRNTDCGARLVCNLLFHSSSNEHQEFVVEQLCFSNKASSSGFGNSDDTKEKDLRRWSRWILETIAPSPALCDGMDGAIKSSFSNHLATIADRWSQLTFVQEVGGRLQHHVSLVLWHGLVHLEGLSVSLQESSQRTLTAALVNGVSHRLGSILPTLRQDGMRIAQQLAIGLGQDGVQFDEFIDDSDSDCGGDRQDKSTYDSNGMVGNEKIEIVEREQKSQSKHEIHGFFDPDAEYDSDVEVAVDEVSDKKDRSRSTYITGDTNTVENEDLENDDLSVEWKDELIPYDLEDDEEDLRETPKPLHLLEALDLLRTGENHDHAFTRHEAALEALPSLVRKRPDDLADVAVSLALELLRMEDKFNIDDFNTKRESAIRTLLVEESLSVGQALIEQLFEESGLSDKLLILASLQSAAFELSGNKALAEASTNSISSNNERLSVGQDKAKGSMLSPSNQVSRVLSKTRRKRSRGQQRKSIKNNFSGIAPMWFYTLIAGFLKHREDEVLWTGSTGSILLAYFFRCLATIVEFSGFQASQVLANDLFDLVWDFRTADVPEVRLSALVAVSTSIAMLSNEKLASLLFDKDTLSKTMIEMSQRDSDKECRSLCQTISLSIHEVLNSNI